MKENEEIIHTLEKLSGTLNPARREVSVILAAGHGKRIKSERSKMLHEIWGKPSVTRVSIAAAAGLESDNQIIVLGKKALDVARALGKRKNRVFVYQAAQNGTGDAVRTALDYGRMKNFKGSVYIFPGDMGLLSEHAVSEFKTRFAENKCDMLVMTGRYEGKSGENYYGRIVKSRESGEVIEIKEHKDILAMEIGSVYRTNFRGTEETFRREELLDIREFNTGVYAIRIDALKKNLPSLKPNNVQKEIYITDLIKIFNDTGLRVCASAVTNNSLVEAFNVKSVLRKMEATFRAMVYDTLKDIVSIDDAEDFYIAEETVERIVELDGRYKVLDIRVGKGAYIGPDVEVNRGLFVGRNAIITGNVRTGLNVRIDEGAMLSTYQDQTIEIGDETHIYRGNVLQGSIRIGKGVRIETGVRITGSSESPVIVGDNVQIKGMTYIFGSVIENDILIEHSILKKRHVERVTKKDGSIQPVKYLLPYPEGLDSIRDL
ncbi:MAG: NTP transferase domain-containing protein [Spirochaetes bacterium]|nr:NTP transferase domain-containing protein [Spirochaetota bacterium]